MGRYSIMAFIRRKAAAAKRKMYKKKKTTTVNVNRALKPFAQKYITSMKYAESFQLSSMTNIQRFNLNSIYDPNRTGTGHQPYGHDQLSPIYNRYRVLSCSYRIECYPVIAEGVNAVQLTALPANESVSPASVSATREDPRCKYIVQTTGGGTKVLKGTVNIPSLMGRNSIQYTADDRYQAQFGSDPAELAILNLYSSNLIDGASPTINCIITLTYKVEVFDPNTLGQS